MEKQFKIKLVGYEGFRYVTLPRMPRSCGCDGTLAEWIEEAFREQYGAPNEEKLEITLIRALPDVARLGVSVLRVVAVDRCYGGPEEGGWYYDDERLERQFLVPTSKARRLRDRLERVCESWNEGKRKYDDTMYYVRNGEHVERERPHYC